MNGGRLSSENLHATSVALNGRAVLLSGPSGSGKSDLALRLLDRGFEVVSDDRTIVRRDCADLVASAPDTIRGKLEIRGIGIINVPAAAETPVALVVDLTGTMERLPDDSRERIILGIAVPLVSIDATTASAASKVEMALDHFGLSF